MTGDVFEDDPFRFDLSDDAGDMRPQVPFVVGATALSREGERLAWVSCGDCVDDPAPWAAVECCEIVPYRGGGKISGALGGDDA